MKPLESKVFPDFDTEFVQLKNCLPDYKVKKKLFRDRIVISQNGFSAYLRYDQSQGWIPYKASKKKKLGVLIIGYLLVLLFNLLGALIFYFLNRVTDEDEKELINFNHTLKSKLPHQGIDVINRIIY
jgi:hypothetical protein